MRIVSFFAGCGGLDLGFEQAGFEVIWANDFDNNCLTTYLRNHHNTKFVLADLSKLDIDSIPESDGFIGGPPCQSWSIGGNQKGLEDKRGKLFLKYIEIIKAKKPKFFVIENVKGILDIKFKTSFEGFLSSLKEAGYDVNWNLLNAVDFSIPQYRERVFIIGFRKDLDIFYRFPSPNGKKYIDLKQAIGDINSKPTFYSHQDLVEPLSINCSYPNHDVLNSPFGNFYLRGNRRKKWTQPSFTINATASFAPLHPSSPEMIFRGREKWFFQNDKKNEYRRLSVRECARIQTFPDSFILDYKDIRNGYKMIGNAVPPRLAKQIAKTILEAFGLNNSNKYNPQNNDRDDLVLIGYYKDEFHLESIKKNLMYYVRNDNRKGSFINANQNVKPKYLLLHHNEKKYFFPLVNSYPVEVEKSFLLKRGFKVNGTKYLLFLLKDFIQDIKQYSINHNENLNRIYSPIILSISDLEKKGYELRQRTN